MILPRGAAQSGSAPADRGIFRRRLEFSAPAVSIGLKSAQKPRSGQGSNLAQASVRVPAVEPAPVHEATILHSLIRVAAAHVPEGAVLRRLHVRVGALTGVSPDSMHFYFDVMRPGRAELEVTLEPLHASCEMCGIQATLTHPLAACPSCSAPGLTYENGLELDLIAIEVADAVDDTDRTEDSG